MRKKTIAVILSVLAIGLLNGCQGAGGNDIGKEKAQEIAFADAQVSEADISKLQISKDDENGDQIYEVEFTDTVSQIEYDYEILASDGTIRKVNKEKVASGKTASQANPENGNNEGQSTEQKSSENTTQESAQNSADADVAVSIEEATKKALEKVEGATETDIKIRLEHDDGRNVYEGEIIYNQKEYDFEIDADTGEILEWSVENSR